MEQTPETVTVKSVKALVAEQIAQAGPTVAATVVEKLALVEITRRTELIITALAKLDTLRKEYSKMKPDNITIVEVEGKGTESASWTKAAFKNYTEAGAKIASLEGLINKALEKNDGESYGKLPDAIK